MDTRYCVARCALAGVIILALCAAGEAADEITRARAAEKFRSAFKPGMRLEERKKKLRKVAEQYRNTVWADDAVWCLSRIDLRKQDHEKFLERARELFELRNIPSLEPLTRRTFIYQQSRMPAVVWILEKSGARYRQAQNEYRVRTFNAIPMTLRADMGRVAEKLGNAAKALRNYQEAVALAPGGTLFNRQYNKQVDRLRQIVRHRKKADSARKENSSSKTENGDEKENDKGDDERKEKVARE